MPANFPEVWETRVRELLTTQDQAPWLDGIDELDSPVVEMGEENMIHVPLETFDPDVLVNNTTYPLDVQDHADGTKTISLDKFQTKPTKISDDAAIGASYSKIDTTTKRHRTKITSWKFKKAIHAIAPASNSTDTPVISLPANYTSEDVYKKLVELKGKFDALEAPDSGRRIVLASAHYNKLLEDRQRFGDLLVDHNTGKVNKLVAGFEVYTYVSNPHYAEVESVWTKKAWGSVVTGTDKQASVAFLAENIGKKTGLTKQYYDKPDTKTQAHLLNYRHYFVALPLRNKYIGAII